MSGGLLIGTHVRGGTGDSARREAAAQASLTALAATGTAACVNLGFADEDTPAGTLPTLRVLQQEGSRLAGVPGPKKPAVDEMLDALAREAARRGLSRMALANGDIVVLPEAVTQTTNAGIPAFAVSRIDIGGGEPDAPLLYGVDMFVFDLEFWRRERRRFRAYLLGDAVWDNVYASVIACHGGRLLNRERLILHERHVSGSRGSVYAGYVHLLAARDSSYFSRWCDYVGEAETIRARGGSADEELDRQRAIFQPPGPLATATDIARAAWWRLKAARRA